VSVLFEYQELASKLRVSQDRLRELEQCVRKQYGLDEMMFELRMVRTLKAIEAGAVTLEEAIAEFSHTDRGASARTARG